jgi:2-amino-4-hydroxy-6-hydroxymethyldihydropteridine diphosphokinase
VYETEPWGLTDQPNFLNIVLKVDCSHVPQNLLKACLAIEEQMGRKRVIKWGARTIDIDILFFHDEIIASSNLEIPHPGIIDRRFTLLPLSEIAGDQIHPVTNETIKQLLDKHTDDQSCKRTELLLIP